MSKILALYQNEMYKTLKRVSIIVFAILIIASGLVTPGIFKLLDTSMQAFSIPFYSEEENLKQELEFNENELKTVTDQLEAVRQEGASQEIINSYLLNIQDYEYSIELLNFQIEYEFFDYSSNGFANMAFQTIRIIRSAQWSLLSVPEEYRGSEWNAFNSMMDEDVDKLFEIIRNKDFDAFVTFNKDLINTPYSSYLDENYMSSANERLDLWYQIDPSGGMDGTADYSATLSSIEYYLAQKDALDTGVYFQYDLSGSSSAKPLSPEKQDELENILAVLDYKIEENQFNLQSSEVFSSFSRESTTSLGVFFVTILTFILAGSSISQEIATGSIKSLIISPVRRWKIFVAKYLSLLTVAIFGLLMVWIFSNIGNTLFFGSRQTVPYVYAVNGVVQSMPFVVFDFLRLLASSIDILVLMTFAFMLSVITRNTALSVGTALATSFIITPVASVLTQIAVLYRSWMDFLPFMNFNIVSALFPFEHFLYPLEMAFTLEAVSAKGPTLTFSLVYLTILVACMFYIGFDSFTRRDIK